MVLSLLDLSLSTRVHRYMTKREWAVDNQLRLPWHQDKVRIRTICSSLFLEARLRDTSLSQAKQPKLSTVWKCRESQVLTERMLNPTLFNLIFTNNRKYPLLMLSNSNLYLVTLKLNFFNSRPFWNNRLLWTDREALIIWMTCRPLKLLQGQLFLFRFKLQTTRWIARDHFNRMGTSLLGSNLRDHSNSISHSTSNSSRCNNNSSLR